LQPGTNPSQHYEHDSWNDVGTNLYGCLKQLNLLKRKNRHLKLLLSIGGWTYSSNFALPASTTSGRSTFAKSSIELVKQLGLDGIDIDWEYPKSPTEGSHLVALLAECRHQFDAYACTLSKPYHFELTVACPAGAQNLANMDLRGMDQYLDFWNLMAYDFAGSWDAHAGHQANLFPSQRNPASTPFSIAAAVKHYRDAGIASSKIVLGMPLYGRAFENTDGPGKPYSGTGAGTWENGVHDFKKLPLEGAQEVCDEEAGATYCYDAQKKVLVTYDTVDMARRKASWIKENGLGGGMWWESSADKERDESLIENVVGVLGRLETKENCLEYPETKYENLKKGFPGEGAYLHN
jgi:chitinase